MAFRPYLVVYTPEPTRCGDGATPGARVLQSWACDESPWAEHLWDVGIFACRDVFGGWCPRCDRDNLSAHASGRAGDSACNLRSAAAAAFALWLVENHAILGVQEVIWNRRRWTNITKRWVAYNGASPHIDHVHWTLHAQAGRYLTRARILSVAPSPPAPPAPDPEVDDMPKQMLVYLGPKTRHVCQVSAARDSVVWLPSADAVRGAKAMLRGDTEDPKAGAVCRLDPTAANTNATLRDLGRYVCSLPFYGPMPPGHANLHTGPHFPEPATGAA